jgi:hypothetical protein
MATTSSDRYKKLGISVALAGEPPAPAGTLLHAIEADLRPRTFLERTMAEDIAVNLWRQNRIRALEKDLIESRAREALQTGHPETTSNWQSLYAESYRRLCEESGILQMLHRFDRGYSRENAATLRLFLQFRVTRYTALSGSGQSETPRRPLLFDPPGDPDAIDWTLFEEPEPETNKS